MREIGSKSIGMKVLSWILKKLEVEEEKEASTSAGTRIVE